MPGRRLIVMLALTGLIALAPLASVSLPDSTWQAGVYDDADFDDVVLAVLAMDGLSEFGTVPVDPPRRSAPAVRADAAPSEPAGALAPPQPRAPPA